MNCIIETNAIYNDFFLSVRSQWTHNNYLCSIIVKIRRIDGRRFGSEASEMPHIEGSSPLLSILFTDVRMQVRVPAYSTHLQNLAWRGNQYAGTVLNHSPSMAMVYGRGENRRLQCPYWRRDSCKRWELRKRRDVGTEASLGPYEQVQILPPGSHLILRENTGWWSHR